MQKGGRGAGGAALAGDRVFYTNTPGELYLLNEDPYQKVNLAEAHPARAEALRRRLLRWYAENDVLGRRLGKVDARKPLLSEKEKERLRALGYVQ